MGHLETSEQEEKGKKTEMLDEKQAGVCGNFKLLLLGSATAETDWINIDLLSPLLSLELSTLWFLYAVVT